jgi:hypothetical protein
MFLLVVREPGKRPRALTLHGTHTFIGRAEDADLVLPSLAVSRRHACVQYDGVHHEILDLDSRNGLTVNGDRVQGRILEHADVIRIGRYQISFLDDSMLAPAERTQIASMGPPAKRSLDSGSDTLFVPGSGVVDCRDPDAAVIVREDRQGERWQPGARRLTFGPSGDIPVDAGMDAGLLAEITWDGEHHLLQRLSLLGKVDVNGARAKTVILVPGDRLDIGEATFRFLGAV